MSAGIMWGQLVVIVLMFASPVLGVIMLTLGIRGRARFASPTCAKCVYDLRAANFMAGAPGTCPECGADLAGAKAVSFGRYERSRKTIIGGVGLLLLPLVLLFLLYAVRTTRMGASAMMTGPSVLPSQSTAQILSGLPAVADQPWSWQELSSRLKAGKLSPAEVDTALATLVQSINAARAKNPSPQPLFWANDFVKDAIASGKVSQARMQALCEAFFANAIQIETPKAVRAGRPIEISMQCNAPWDVGGNSLVWLPAELKTGGAHAMHLLEAGVAKDLSLPSAELSQRSQGYLSLKAESLSETGEQELVFVFDAGAVGQNATLRGKDGKPGLKKQWPSPLATWQVTVKKKIRVMPADQIAVELDTDAAHDPQRTKNSLVKEAIVRKATGGVEVVVQWDWTGAPRPPIAGKVTATVGGREVDMGSLVWGQLPAANGGERGWGGEQSRSSGQLPSLSPETKSMSLRVVPDPAYAERMLGLDTIWGKPVEIKDIPLQRFDLDAEAAKDPR